VHSHEVRVYEVAGIDLILLRLSMSGREDNGGEAWCLVTLRKAFFSLVRSIVGHFGCFLAHLIQFLALDLFCLRFTCALVSFSFCRFMAMASLLGLPPSLVVEKVVDKR
jgi:hypothetical protein